MRVDFPEPLGPMIAVMAAGLMAQEMLLRMSGPAGYRKLIEDAEMVMARSYTT